jgi:hypothetical protein
MKVTAGLLYILALILTACQVESPTSLPTSVPPSVSPTQGNSQMTPSLTLPADTELQTLIEKAKEDLAQRLGISADDITVATVINQDFPTDVFNCRSSKERIAKEEPPLVVSGQSIILNASGQPI